MNGWFRRSLKRKITFLLLISILLPLLSLGLFSYFIASNITEEKVKASGMSIMRQMGSNLEFFMRDIENSSLFLIGNKDVQMYLNVSEKEANLRQNRMTEFLSNLMYSKNYVSDITIYPASQALPVSNTTIFKVSVPDITISEPDYYVDHPYWWTSLYPIHTAAGKKNILSLIRPIRNVNTFQYLGKLVISLDESMVAKTLKKSGIGDNGFMLLIDGNGNVLSGSLSPLPSTIADILPEMPSVDGTAGSINYGTGGDKKTVLYRKLPEAGWTLIGVIPFADYKSQNRYVLTLTAAAVGVSLLAIVVLVVFFVQRLTRPLRMLTNFLNNTDPEEPMRLYPVESMDEVGQLVRSYNKLSGKIEALTDQVKLTEAMKTEADMQALQAQINPHFLYNTLSSIHWMALMNQDHQTADMVGNLSDFLRFSLNKGAQFTSVEQEIAHVRHYANIQAIRYPDQFDIVFAIDSQLYRKKILKLLLQPLIENALVHGLHKKPGKGAISVHASLQGSLMTFTVEDSGAGIAADKLAHIRTRLNEPEEVRGESKDHYGLRNVNLRLLLHYGADAGLKIESTEGVGTIVSFSLPVTEESIA
ncbi:sensor histidine kinase [Paenibacillus lupini]|uniref:cache domain-containing sensor histidine kinase n=1 Tax=Paenibacillus lupini TaxID=1450204 RepID=UPI001424A0E3|nr:sensor histidine kinase [Paenibacillus lupini]NIK26037.1 two-component system sensor histidine kinase YesM [Paenibacillus lupini]